MAFDSSIARARQLLMVVSLVLNGLYARAQAPVINSVQTTNSGPLQKITINGSGFSSNASQLSVWFDHVPGNIASASDFSIQVTVPPQARLSNVEVANLGNGLSAKSASKLVNSFGGGPFDATKVSTPFTAANSFEFFDVAAADFDADGKVDMVLTQAPNGALLPTDLVVMKNTSTGIGTIAFQRFDKNNLANLNLAAPSANVITGDVNGDGKPEIIATRNGSTRNQVYILRNTNTVIGTLSFATPLSLFLPNGSDIAFRTVLRDLNGDGKPELIVSNSFDDLNSSTDNQFFIFPNQSSGSSIVFGIPISVSVLGGSTSYGLDVQDLDGDGRADIVVNQFQSNDLFVFRNTSTGSISFAAAQKITAAGSFNNVVTADLNQDGLLDLIVSATLDNKAQVFVNKSTVGAISFNPPQVLSTALGPWGVDISDIDGDGDADLLVANRNEARVNVFRQDNALSFSSLSLTTAKPCRNLRVADFDADGKPDIAVTSFAVSQFSVDVLRNANCVQPVITSTTSVICNGQTVRLQTKPALGITFDWKLGGVTVQSSTQEFFDATAAGSYTVTATGTFDTGCAITSAPLVLSTNPASPPSDPPINFASACVGGALNLTTNTIANASYAWQGPNNFSSNQQNPTISPLAAANAGTYQLQVTVNGCSSNVVQRQVDVFAVPVLPVNASATTVCVGGGFTLSVTGVGYNYQWKKDGANLTGQVSPNLTLGGVVNSDEGSYSVLVTSVALGCSQETGKTNIAVYTRPNASFTVGTPLCTNSPVPFVDQSTKDARGTLTYAWTFGDGKTASIANPSNTYTAANTYTVGLTVNYVGISGCSNATSQTVVVSGSNTLSISATANPICPSESSQLTFSGVFTSINWTGVSGNTNSVTIRQPGTYSVTAKDANGCNASGAIIINSKPTINPFSVTTDKNTIKTGEQVQLTATAGADAYRWSPGKLLNDSLISNPIGKPIQTTFFKVIVSKSGFCAAKDSVLVTVLSENAVLDPPVVFSPNGDTFNDTWLIPEALNFPEHVMTVYDRHGSLVYQQKGYTSANAWDGTYAGKAVPDGVYYFVFTNGSDKPITGSVLVAR